MRSRFLIVATAIAWTIAAALSSSSLHAQARAATTPVATAQVRSGEQVFRAACAACHGVDGRGVSLATRGFETELPDFTDCSFASPEADADWFAIAHEGGPVRAFDQRMPSFGEALTATELAAAITHIRTFCTDPAWPRGELNLPRALLTEKAFPENEALLTTAITAGETKEIGNELLYEKRFGARNQFEIVVPLMLQHETGVPWSRGLGDVAIAVKRVLFHSLPAGHILSLGGEVTLPTGKESTGLGNGVTLFEPFVLAGQILPRDSFVQLQAGGEMALHGEAESEAFARIALGRTWVQGDFGRAWTPMLEVVATRELEAGQRTEWSLVPQMQVSLSKRQHILMSGGLKFDVNSPDGRNVQVLTYLLWDWFDGGFFSGWR